MPTGSEQSGRAMVPCSRIADRGRQALRVHLLATICIALGLPWSFARAAQSPLSAHVTIAVTGLKAPRITADYRLSHPVSEIRFKRDAHGLRTEIWHMETPGLAVRKDSVVSTSGRTFDHFRVLVAPRTRLMNLNYVAVDIFSGHGAAVFTGYFNIAGASGNTSFSFRSAHQKAFVLGNAVAPSATFAPADDGTFAYFGDIKPDETPDSAVLLDPSLPTWMRSELHREVPRIIKFYSVRYGVKLPKRPFLLFSWDQRKSSQGDAYQGDSLYGTVSFVFTGSGWKKPTAGNKGRLARVIAHELAHQWNAGLYKPSRFDSEGGSWLAEGQAEFAATAAAERFGWLSPAAARHHYTTLVNQCLQAPSAKPVEDQRHDDRAIYGCGVTFNLLAQAALEHHRPRRGFFDLWRTIYAAAAQNGDRYSTDTYVDALARLSGNHRVTAMIARLVKTSASDKNRKILFALKHLGFGLAHVTASNHDPDLGRAAAGPLFEAIMRGDCNGAVSFYTHSWGFTVDPVKSCRTLTKPYAVTAIDGQALFTNGVAAYREVQSHCAAGRPVQLDVKGRAKPVSVECLSRIPPMPAMVEITSLPWANASAASGQSRKHGIHEETDESR